MARGQELFDNINLNARTVAAGSPVTSDPIVVDDLDFIAFDFSLDWAAATSVEWWFLTSIDGVNYRRNPANKQGSGANVTHNDGENTRTGITGDDAWPHEGIRVTPLHSMKIVVDSTNGTTDAITVTARGAAEGA